MKGHQVMFASTGITRNTFEFVIAHQLLRQGYVRTDNPDHLTKVTGPDSVTHVEFDGAARTCTRNIR